MCILFQVLHSEGIFVHATLSLSDYFLNMSTTYSNEQVGVTRGLPF